MGEKVRAQCQKATYLHTLSEFSRLGLTISQLIQLQNIHSFKFMELGNSLIDMYMYLYICVSICRFW